MADLSITAANVTVNGTAVYVERNAPAGAAVTAGQVVYKKAADSKYYLAKSSGTAEEATAAGIAVANAAIGQPFHVATGSLNIGATTVLGGVYVLSATPGAICPAADLATTNYVTVLGVGGDTTARLFVAPLVSGYQHA